MTGLLLSIDFEDFAHDLKRDLGLWQTGPLRVDALWRGYERIEAFLQGQGAARATFFCTGVVAEQVPDLLRRIARDGHEIACHYHFHDEMDRQGAAEVALFAARAKDALETAAGTELHGFRAPKFRIEKHDPAQYREIARLFAYDSSWFGPDREAARVFLSRLGCPGLRLFPIYAGRPLPGLPALRLGGSYLKLFPREIGQRLVSDCRAAGMTPHIYLHPYEFLSDGAFCLSRRELAPLGPRKAAYWHLRQAQWHRAGNAGLEDKLARLITPGRLLGRLQDNLAEAL